MNDASRYFGAFARATIKLGEIEIEIHEGGSGPPLLFLHGGSGPLPARRFSSGSREFRVIAPAHPGFGDRACRSGSIQSTTSRIFISN